MIWFYAPKTVNMSVKLSMVHRDMDKHLYIVWSACRRQTQNTCINNNVIYVTKNAVFVAFCSVSALWCP